MTQITQIKIRTLRDVICVNLRDLRENNWAHQPAEQLRAGWVVTQNSKLRTQN
jgi:hypothetical protein